MNAINCQIPSAHTLLSVSLTASTVLYAGLAIAYFWRRQRRERLSRLAPARAEQTHQAMAVTGASDFGLAVLSLGGVSMTEESGYPRTPQEMYECEMLGRLLKACITKLQHNSRFVPPNQRLSMSVDIQDTAGKIFDITITKVSG